MFQYEYPHFAVATDVALFTLLEDELKLLLIRRRGAPYKGSWALPGGFLTPRDETLEACAARELREEAGVWGFYLEQLYTFGDQGRDPRERVISVAYYALVPGEGLTLTARTDADAAAWFPANTLPELAFDHAQIIQLARRRLASKLDYSTVAFQFLPNEFALSDLQRVYEAVKGEKLDKRNFRKFILGLGLVEPTGNERRGGPSRPAKLYRAKTGHRLEYFR